jgi:large subunit ribosomal protein L30
MPKSTSSKTKAAKKPRVLQITLVKSPIGYSVTHKATIRALGLRRMHQTVEQVDSSSLRGMIAKVRHLVDVVEATEA